jgi:hypothetical protein
MTIELFLLCPGAVYCALGSFPPPSGNLEKLRQVKPSVNTQKEKKYNVKKRTDRCAF